jgi:hypothetical protein
VTMADNSNLFKKTQIKQIKKHTKTNFCVRQFPIFFGGKCIVEMF